MHDVHRLYANMPFSIRGLEYPWTLIPTGGRGEGVLGTNPLQLLRDDCIY